MSTVSDCRPCILRPAVLPGDHLCDECVWACVSADASPKVSGSLTKNSSCLQRLLFTSSLLFITILVSELLAALRPTDFVWPPLFFSPPVSLSVFSLLSFCASSSWSGRSWAGGCHGNLSYPYRLMDHPWIVFLPLLPKNAHTKARMRSPFPPSTLSPLFISLNCNHNILPLSASLTPLSKFSWVSQVTKLTLWASAESDETSLTSSISGVTVDHVSVGFVTLPPLLEGIAFSREEYWPEEICGAERWIDYPVHTWQIPAAAGWDVSTD